MSSDQAAGWRVLRKPGSYNSAHPMYLYLSCRLDDACDDRSDSSSVWYTAEVARYLHNTRSTLQEAVCGHGVGPGRSVHL